MYSDKTCLLCNHVILRCFINEYNNQINFRYLDFVLLKKLSRIQGVTEVFSLLVYILFKFKDFEVFSAIYSEAANFHYFKKVDSSFINVKWLIIIPFNSFCFNFHFIWHWYWMVTIVIWWFRFSDTAFLFLLTLFSATLFYFHHRHDIVFMHP